MDLTVTQKEYFDLIYTKEVLKLQNIDLKNEINKKNSEIERLYKLLKKSEEMLNKIKPIISVSPTGDISFSDEIIKNEVNKSVVKDIVLDTNLKSLFTKTDELEHKVNITFDAIKNQDGVIIERSIEKELDSQIESIKKTYDELFIKDLKENYELKNSLIKESAKHISGDVINLPDTIQYRSTGDPLYEQYSKFYYTIKGDNSGKIYKVKGVSYESSPTNKRKISKVIIKLVNTVLSAEEIAVEPDKLIRGSFRDTVDGMKCKVVKKSI